MVRPYTLRETALPGMREKVAAFVEHPRTVKSVTLLIVLNAITLGLETNPAIRADFSLPLHVFDIAVLGVFVLELALKLFAYRLPFFRMGWNIFDFVIVAGSLASVGGSLTVLRTLRIFRVLRLMSVVPQMRRVVTALLDAVPGMISITGVLLVIFYVGAVLTTQIFGSYDAPEMKHLFGSIGASMYTLFQIMTLEGWSDGVVEPTMAYFPWAWAFFVPFIIVTSFAVLNLFIGIIVDAMDIVHDLEDGEKSTQDAVHAEAAELRTAVSELRRDIAALRETLDGKK